MTDLTLLSPVSAPAGSTHAVTFLSALAKPSGSTHPITFLSPINAPSAGPAPSVSIDLSALPASLTVGTAMSANVTATNENGATGAITISAASLPPGLSISATTGTGPYTATISGTPTTEADAANFAISASNGVQSDSKSWNVRVNAASTGNAEVIFAGMWSETNYGANPYHLTSTQDIQPGDKLVVCVMTDDYFNAGSDVHVTDNQGNTFSFVAYQPAADNRANSVLMHQLDASAAYSASSYTLSVDLDGTKEYIKAIALLILRGASWALDSGDTVTQSTSYSSDALPVGPVSTVTPAAMIVVASGVSTGYPDMVVTGTGWTTDVASMASKSGDYLPFLVAHKLTDTGFTAETATVNYSGSGNYDRKTLIQAVFTHS